MFTGIVEEVGEVIDAGRGVLRVPADRTLHETKFGDSVAVDGVDVTVTDINGHDLSFNVMPERYRQTTYGGWWLTIAQIKDPTGVIPVQARRITKGPDAYCTYPGTLESYVIANSRVSLQFVDRKELNPPYGGPPPGGCP